MTDKDLHFFRSTPHGMRCLCGAFKYRKDARRLAEQLRRGRPLKPLYLVNGHVLTSLEHVQRGTTVTIL